MATQDIPAFPRELPPLIVWDGDTKYFCSGQGLRYGDDSETYVDDMNRYLAPTYVTYDINTPPSFWKAQSAFRGGPHGTMAAAKAWLMEHPNERMTDELKRLQERTNRRYLEANHAAREKRWANCKSDDERAEADIERLLKEKLAIPAEEGVDSGSKVIVLREFMMGSIYEHTAREAGFAVNSLRDPASYHKSDNPYERHRLVIVGRQEDKEAVNAKWKELYQESQQAEKSAKSNRIAVAKGKHQEVVRLWEESVRKGERRVQDWDVVGHWVINCPELENGWDMDKSLVMTIYRSESAKGKFMYATFNFNIVEGVLWCEKPKKEEQAAAAKKWRQLSEKEQKSSASESTPASFLSTLEQPAEQNSNGKRKSGDITDINPEPENNDNGSNKKVKAASPDADAEAEWEDASSSDSSSIGGDSDDDDDDDDEGQDVPDPIFPLGATDIPSPSLHTFPFRWRGTETGEGSAQLYSDCYVDNITFGGTGGMELKGRIVFEFVGDTACEFTGIKVGNLGDANGKKTRVPDIRVLWAKEERNYSGQYEHDCFF